MKKILLTIILFLPLSIIAQVTTDPSPIEIDQEVTITIQENSNATDCNGFSNPTKIYAHLGVGDDTDEYGISVVGNWGQDDGVGLMTETSTGIWEITFTPKTYFGLNAAQEANVTKMGMVFRNEDGSQEFKANGCQNFIFNVGAFQIDVFSPAPSDNGFLVVDNPGSTAIVAQTGDGSQANFQLFANGSSINIQNNISFYFYQFNNITENQFCEIVVTQGENVRRKSFIILTDGTISQNLPSSPANLEDGINYHPSDPTKATLLLNAEGKDFVYVAGSFNSYTPTDAFAMRKDPTSGKFWLELSGLTSGDIETYQYWVADQTPVADSPKVVKTADPFSTLVLSPFDDPWISNTTFPGLTTTYAYPAGQEREVTVLQTGQTPYNWQVTNFSKPKKEDLIIYEVLIRDFDADRNFQDLIDRIDYFKNLNINAIQLMPVMEFEGNESWGYNTSFHLALDKFYGTEEKFKDFIDLCHQNGIAVILDVALNHAFGRNPMNRMWMDDPDGDGWGEPSSENPYMNEEATHSYSVGSDFNHQSILTQYYTERVIKRWVEDFKIDGFRWDLTKGFTQQCSSGDESCTNGYRSDRVAILKDYADYSWSLDPDHYVIFEHLGGNSEETEWAEYKIGEGKGIMLWGKMTDPYNQMTMGYNSSNDISGMGHNSRGWSQPRLVGYAESHDEERLMYKNVAFGASGIQGNLNTALNRMDALGAISLTIPGPKMIWHFGELGMDNS
ncbi:MAG: alpha-amylase, partial [Flavobacteriaceae bacterium]|nr:alpha-amylase [Flavobacteriaceae bacterium]